MQTLDVKGATILKSFIDLTEQKQMVEDIARVVAAAPPFHPVTPWGKPMTVRMTSAGRYGWYADRKGYRYITEHPDGTPWPPIPHSVLKVWEALARRDRAPDCCLINQYHAKARMGLHQDKDEADFSWPVLSISLGETGVFRIGGLKRSDPTESVRIESGDVLLLSGQSRLAFHGIDRIIAGSSSLLPEGGRINLTLRVVD